MTSHWTYLLFRFGIFGTRGTSLGQAKLAALPRICSRGQRRAGTRSEVAILSRTGSDQRPKLNGQHPHQILTRLITMEQSSADNKSGIGVVVRDCRGEVIASLVQQLDQAFQPMEVVAMAACRAVEFGSELGLHNVIVEGDSELIVKALRCKDNGLTSYAHLINDVLLFSGLFSELSYSHLKRNGNKVTHSLVRLSLISPSCTMWMEDVPSCTLPFVQADLAAL